MESKRIGPMIPIDQRNSGAGTVAGTVAGTAGTNFDDLIDSVLDALPLSHKALELGQAIYRCRAIAWEKRWRVARECLKYEEPTLGVVAQVNDSSFAEALEGCLKRMKLIEHPPIQPKQIEARPQIETPKPKPHINDRRYRRF